jgi:FtsP/CotA-like multicopper oxidase with cupredoxin domain
MHESTHRFHADLPMATTWAYNDSSIGGPWFHLWRDTEAQVLVKNELGAHPLAANIDPSVPHNESEDAIRPRANLHLHGGITPPGSDGHPRDTFRPGGEKLYVYPCNQDAAGLWMHDHTMGLTRLNVHAGLFAPVVMRDQWDDGQLQNPLGLPAGEFEIPLTLQDRGFDEETGEVRYRSFSIVEEGKWEGGQIGDVMCVNGVAWPELEVARSLYRFRVTNACNFATLQLAFSNEMPFWVVGNDQGLLNAPEQTTKFWLGSSERIDIVVDFSSLGLGEAVQLVNDRPHAPQVAGFGMPDLPDIMQFRATGGPGPYTRVPTVLRGEPGLPEAIPTIEQLRPMVSHTKNMTIQQRLAARWPPAIMLLDNLGWEDDPDVSQAGRVEQWNLINTTPDDHPIHIHLARLQVVGRTPYNSLAYQTDNPAPEQGIRWDKPADDYAYGGMLPAANFETGWKDSVLAPGNTITRVLVAWPDEEEAGFDPTESFIAWGGNEEAGYVFHCHILDHEDFDMMRPIQLEHGGE